MRKDKIEIAGEIIPPPVIRPELVAVATETHNEVTAEDHERAERLKVIEEKTSRKRDLDEKLGPIAGPVDPRVVAMATGAPVEKIIELQSQPKPYDPELGLTGDAEIDVLYRDCIKCFAEKGAEYTVGSVDRLANFRGVAEDVGIEMEKAWYVFFNKHLRALQAYIKNGCMVKSNEPIQGRIMDLIVYLTLFYKMTLEIERKREAAAKAEHGIVS